MGGTIDFFLATETELRALYPTWKEPLERPVQVSRMNPFTREPMDFPSWDPDPTAAVEEEEMVEPPSPSLWLEGVEETNLESLIEIVHDSSEETKESYNRPSLIGPNEGPWLRQLPSAFVVKLAAMDDAGLARVAVAWSKAQRGDITTIVSDSTREDMLARFDAIEMDYWQSTLAEFATFARVALAKQREIYVRTCA